MEKNALKGWNNKSILDVGVKICILAFLIVTLFNTIFYEFKINANIITAHTYVCGAQPAVRGRMQAAERMRLCAAKIRRRAGKASIRPALRTRGTDAIVRSCLRVYLKTLNVTGSEEFLR